MPNTTIVISILLLIIAVLLAVIALGLIKKNSNSNSSSKSRTAIVKSQINAPRLTEVTQIVLQNALGQELAFKKPSEITDAKYKEVTITGAGNVIQHAEQGAGEIYTLKELSNIAGKELYTHPRARASLHEYGGVGSGKYSSTLWGNNKKIAAHEGFEAFNASEALAGVNPALITMVVMQGMAIVSGQYFLKQINTSLRSIGKDIQELKEIHESEKRGTLTHCRKRLMEISQMQHCSEADIIEIRSIANDAGKILEEYKDRYYAAKEDAENYWYSSGSVDKAIKEYNRRLEKMRYLLQVCMVADRIVDEARLAEFVVRRKMDINDPALQDVYNLMEENYRNGFNARIIEESENISDYMINKGWGIINDSALPHRNSKLINVVEYSMDEMQEDVFNMTGSVRRMQADQDELEDVALLLSENEEPRFFVEVKEDDVE